MAPPSQSARAFAGETRRNMPKAPEPSATMNGSAAMRRFLQASCKAIELFKLEAVAPIDSR